MAMLLGLAVYLAAILFVWWCAETERDVLGRRRRAGLTDSSLPAGPYGRRLRPSLQYVQYAWSAYPCRANTSGRSTPMYGRLR
jgi:hypothetical protein